MKKLNVLLVSLFLLSFGIATSGQNTIPATGGSASGAGGKENYTIGQVIYTTNTSTTGSGSQGVQ